MKNILLLALALSATAEEHHRHRDHDDDRPQVYTVTVSDSRTFQVPFTASLSVQRFNLPGMCLDGARVTQTLGVTSSFYGVNRSAFPGPLALDLDVSLSFPPLTLHRAAHVAQTVNPGPVAFDPLIAGAVATTFDASPAAFAGCGVVSFLASGVVSSSASWPGNFSAQWPLTETASVSVTYSYHKCGCGEEDED